MSFILRCWVGALNLSEDRTSSKLSIGGSEPFSSSKTPFFFLPKPSKFVELFGRIVVPSNRKTAWFFAFRNASLSKLILVLRIRACSSLCVRSTGLPTSLSYYRTFDALWLSWIVLTISQLFWLISGANGYSSGTFKYSYFSMSLSLEI